MKFIKKYWSKNHILALNKNFLNWQHLNYDKKNYNFFIAIFNKQIIGCHGYIKNSKYSKDLIKKDTIWLVNWICLKGKPNPGLNLLLHPVKNLNYSRIGTIGCNNLAKKIYKGIGFKVGYLKHYYLLNPHIKSFNLIKAKKNTNFAEANFDLQNRKLLEKKII